LILGPGMLVLGKFTGLLKSMKVLGTVMVICTTIAFLVALVEKGPSAAGDWAPLLSFDAASFAFLLALMGWMPTAVDLSAWNSIWTVERIRDSGFKPTLKQTLFEFRLGYWVSGILAVMFVFLGAAVLRQSGSTLSDNSGTFAGQVVEVFASTIGSWSWPILALAGFSIMLGTLIAVFDGYGRCLRNSFFIIATGKEDGQQIQSKKLYVFFIWFTALASWLLLYLTVFRAESPVGFKSLVDVATTLSFLVAPVIAVLNFGLVTRKDFPADGRPSALLKTTSLLGIIFLAGFAVIYVLY
jgi:Mn2+/Fe2+ NRAMP family transporter